MDKQDFSSTDDAVKALLHRRCDIDNNAYEANINSLGITVEKIESDKKEDLEVDYGIIKEASR